MIIKAKTSKKLNENIYLVKHSRDVLDVLLALTPVIKNIEKICEIPFSNNDVNVSGILHDFGKANDNFNSVLNGTTKCQMIRHEVVTAILLLKYFKDDLIKNGIDVDSVLLTILGHHKKFNSETISNQHEIKYGNRVNSIKILNQGEYYSDIQDILSIIYQVLGIKLSFPKDKMNLTAESSDKHISKIKREYQDKFQNEKEKIRLGLSKMLLMFADGSASAIGKHFEKNYNVSKYISECLSIGVTTKDIDNIVSNKLKGGQLRDFQIECGKIKSHTALIIGGCGTGKSVGAYECIKNMAQHMSNPKILFCLPTTNTATEHFKDYAKNSGIPSELTHSRAKYDLQIINSKEEDSEEFLKIDCLKRLSCAINIMTVDTILGVMCNTVSGIFSLPMILNGVIVFDEVHSYDDHMFNLLLCFLKYFKNVPVVLMTATLQPGRDEAIKKVRNDTVVVTGPKDLESIKKYNIVKAKNKKSIYDKIDEVVKNNGKILWVKNRVDWANSEYIKLSQKYGDIVEVYHSRFKYKHRGIIHDRIMKAFKAEKALIVVSTQVVEMSLDVDTILLITDVCPITALIQRIGRLGRYILPNTDFTPRLCLIDFYPLSDERFYMPYTKPELFETVKWFKKVNNKAISQLELINEYQNIATPIKYELNEKDCSSFSGIWETRISQIRDTGYTISILLEEDVNNCQEKETWGDPTTGWLTKNIISMPFKDEVKNWNKICGIPIAPANKIKYDFNEETQRGTGASWIK